MLNDSAKQIRNHGVSTANHNVKPTFNIDVYLQSVTAPIWSVVVLVTASLMILVSTTAPVNAEENGVVFPHDYKLGKHYATVNRGGTREELYTSEQAISAAKNNQPFPSGTVIMMEDYRNDELYRYIVMEKRDGWSTSDSANVHAGDWKFQWFNPDRSVRVSENLQRCSSCHASQSDSDYVFTAEKMKGSN